MDKSVDNYLHKKFKKQLSIEPKPHQYDKENKNFSRVLESSEEKTPVSECSNQIRDNKVTVPNQSTNNNNLKPLVNTCEVPKSSISTENCSGNIQSFNPCISTVASSNQSNDDNLCKAVSFDRSFRTTETTNLNSVTSSSVDDYLYYNPNHQSVERENTPPLRGECSSREFDGKHEYKNEEAQPTPEKNPSGKYVCTYCNLVCSKPSVLQKHIRAHTNERPFPCTSCGFSFKTRSNLYKHCRSRTHANRVMGNKVQEGTSDTDMSKQNYTDNSTQTQSYILSNEEAYEGCSKDLKNKPYKPRFHTVQQFTDSTVRETIEDDRSFSGTDLSHHINEIISKNNSIVNSSDPNLLKKRLSDVVVDNENNNEYRFHRAELTFSPPCSADHRPDEPLNLTNKNRKRCMSEIAEPVIQKSLIKELLLKNLYSDMQCPYCKMIFQTVTELELHKLRSCKGKPSEAKYTRSSSVNVASILTKNKNAFDTIPQFQMAMFPLNSPGPFLGKTRLVESDKSKSFSFDTVNLPNVNPSQISPNYVLSPLQFKEEKRTPIKLFGGEVKIHNSAGDSKSYRIDNKGDKRETETTFQEYGDKLSENRVVKSSLQSGGTVLTNTSNKEEPRVFRDVIRVYENTSVSPNIDMSNIGKTHFSYDHRSTEKTSSSEILRPSLANTPFSKLEASPTHKYTNIADFSQNAVKLLTPNLKQPTIHIAGMVPQSILPYSSSQSDLSLLSDSPLASPRLRQDLDTKSIAHLSTSENDNKNSFQSANRTVIQKHLDIPSPVNNIYNPMNILVNGKVVRYVPGMPGPIAAEGPLDLIYGSNIVAVGKLSKDVLSPMQPPIIVSKLHESDNSNLSKIHPKVIQKNTLSVENLMEKASQISSDGYESKSAVSPKLTENKSPPMLIEKKSPIKELKSSMPSEPKHFARPNSLALKPTTASLKQHHGLTPTIFNQILISPDTPRVAKKYAQHLFNGNYFSYLGLKSSTKPVYCTLNKTQPFYVPHFKKLSMYSEWRQQDTKVDKLYVSAYDSRQKNQRCTTAGKTSANLIIHSSYKFVVSELPSKCDKNEESQKSNLIGGFECNEDSPYIRGRGRGRYVCDQCGIRCKKPSMLKKHIRTHSNDRPFTCSHCNFSFKTKGNLTKHMKSKSHTKNYTATNSGSSSSTHLSISQSSESDTDDSGMDSSDESMTRQQEHEAAYGLLSLSQKTTSVPSSVAQILSPSGGIATTGDQFMTSEEIAYVSKTNYAKNKILDNLNFKPSKQIVENISSASLVGVDSKEDKSLSTYLGKTSTTRPLTYPYTTVLPNLSNERLKSPIPEEPKLGSPTDKTEPVLMEPKSIKQFHVIQKYAMHHKSPDPSPGVQDTHRNARQEAIPRSNIDNVKYLPNVVPTLKVNDVVVQDSPVERKRKISVIENNYKNKLHRNDEVMDLSIPSSEKRENSSFSEQRPITNTRQYNYDQVQPNQDIYPNIRNYSPKGSQNFVTTEEHRNVEENNFRNIELNRKTTSKPAGPVLLLKPLNQDNAIYENPDTEMHNTSSSETPKIMEYDNSAMETLADVATKQVKLEKNTLAKSLASEYLKLATQNENLDGSRDSNNFISITNKDVVNDLIVKPEGNKSCTICSKSFNKPFQLRLHMNIHYLERPFRCDSCSVSFRTKGHLQKHERSASHYSKLSSSPAQSSSEPRPFKCSDCNIAFRIHGHLAKHLRSKMHIMKLECLAKIPFGLYAELERSNSLLTEINTSDGDQCLESLKTLAKKVFINDPGKLQAVMSDAVPGTIIDADS